MEKSLYILLALFLQSQACFFWQAGIVEQQKMLQESTSIRKTKKLIKEINKSADGWKFITQTLCDAITDGNTQKVRLLLDAGASLTYTLSYATHSWGVDGHHTTYSEIWPLKSAVCNQDAVLCAMLRAQGADINYQMIRKRRTLLLSAVLNDRLARAEFLITQGADSNIPDCDGVTPLMHAAAGYRYYEEFFILLLAAGAKTTLKSRHGNTVFDYVTANSGTGSFKEQTCLQLLKNMQKIKLP